MRHFIVIYKYNLTIICNVNTIKFKCKKIYLIIKKLFKNIKINGI